MKKQTNWFQDEIKKIRMSVPENTDKKREFPPHIKKKIDKQINKWDEKEGVRYRT